MNYPLIYLLKTIFSILPYKGTVLREMNKVDKQIPCPLELDSIIEEDS